MLETPNRWGWLPHPLTLEHPCSNLTPSPSPSGRGQGEGESSPLSLKAKLEQEIDREADSLRFYFLGSNWQRRVEHIGAKATYDPRGPVDRVSASANLKCCGSLGTFAVFAISLSALSYKLCALERLGRKGLFVWGSRWGLRKVLLERKLGS